MNRARLLFAVFLHVSPLCLASNARAADADEPTSRARAHFERAIVLVKNGSLEAAVSEFELAYAAKPHFSVLFNLGQAYATLGRPGEAAESFERYLAEGGNAVAPAKRKQVRELIVLQRSRIAHVELDVLPAGAEVTIDGRTIGKSPFSSPIALPSGTHGFVVNAPGAKPWFASQALEPGVTSRIVVRLEGEPVQPAPPSFGQVAVRCEVPDVVVEIDGVRRGVTPLRAPIVLASGKHEVSFSRLGYVHVRREVQVGADLPVEVECGLSPSPASGVSTASFVLSVSPASARVRIDGTIYAGGRLPAGVHFVEVERSGFVPWRRNVRLAEGETRRLAISLVPTADTLADWDADRARRRDWAIVLGGIGVGLIGAGVGTYVWSESQRDDWRRDRDALDDDISTDGAGADALRRDAALDREAIRIQRAGHAGVGLGVAGLLVSAAAAFVGFGGPGGFAAPSQVGATTFGGTW